MERPRPQGPGAQDRIGASLGSDAPESIPASLRLQAIPESEAEALTFGYGLPPAAHLTACRATWWRLRRLGVPLPAELRVIRIAGGRDG